MTRNFNIGDTGYHIKDLGNIVYLTELSPSMVITWIKEKCPDRLINICRNIKIGDIKHENELFTDSFENKLYIIIGGNPKGYLAIYKHDFIFYLCEIPF